MKRSVAFLCLQFAVFPLSSFAQEKGFDCTNFSGQWKGECKSDESSFARHFSVESSKNCQNLVFQNLDVRESFLGRFNGTALTLGKTKTTMSHFNIAGVENSVVSVSKGWFDENNNGLHIDTYTFSGAVNDLDSGINRDKFLRVIQMDETAATETFVASFGIAEEVTYSCVYRKI